MIWCNHCFHTCTENTYMGQYVTVCDSHYSLPHLVVARLWSGVLWYYKVYSVVLSLTKGTQLTLVKCNSHISASLLWPNFPDPAFNVYLFLAKLWLLPAEICAHCHIHITSSQLHVYLGIDSILSTLFKVLTALCIYPFAIVIWQSMLYN